MKRNMKILGLAGALALCLLLTGCYQSPDNTTNPDNGAHFNTHPPEATVTVTPDARTTVPPDSSLPEITDSGWPGITDQDGGQYDLPAETSASSQNIWGEVSGPIVLLTPQPSDGVSAPAGGNDIALITSSPYTEIPSPEATPTPKSLQRGYTDNEEVRQLQSRLKELGYYKGSADGDFGPATEEAVKAFQKANGLTADGKAGEKTLARLNGSDAVRAGSGNSVSSSSGGSSSGAASDASSRINTKIYLEVGNEGKNVKTLQNRLIELGWLSGSASGLYDETTEAAVIAFQKKAKLWADGKAGPKTLEALFAASAAKGSNPVSAGSGTLENGSEGSEVKRLQKRLIDLGYLSGSADGKFGPATEAALIEFQKNNGLEADGKAGTKTQNKLYSDEAKRAGISG